MLKDLEVLGVLERVGARFRFTHKTLKEYYQNEPSKVAGKNFSWAIPLVISLIVLALSIRIATRDQYYWQSPIGFNLKVNSGSLAKLDSQTVVVGQDGALELKSKGLVRAGRVMGNVSPLGSESGFFSFPLNESFDIHPEFRHCALLYQASGSSAWKAVYDKRDIPFGAIFPPLKWHICTLSVKANDTLRFMINDGEWENNFGEFQVELTMLPHPDSK